MRTATAEGRKLWKTYYRRNVHKNQEIPKPECT